MEVRANTGGRATSIVRGALVALSALVVIGVLTFAAPCGVHDDGMLSPCHGAGRAVMVTGVVALVAAAVRLRSRGRTLAMALDILMIALGIVIALIPGTLMGLCMMETMRCHVVMKPVMRILGGALAATAAADVLLARRAAATDADIAGNGAASSAGNGTA